MAAALGDLIRAGYSDVTHASRGRAPSSSNRADGRTSPGHCEMKAVPRHGQPQLCQGRPALDVQVDGPLGGHVGRGCGLQQGGDEKPGIERDGVWRDAPDRGQRGKRETGRRSVLKVSDSGRGDRSGGLSPRPLSSASRGADRRRRELGLGIYITPHIRREPRRHLSAAEEQRRAGKGGAAHVSTVAAAVLGRPIQRSISSRCEPARHIPTNASVGPGPFQLFDHRRRRHRSGAQAWGPAA